MALQDRAPAQAVVAAPALADRVPPPALVVGGILSIQFGAALSVTLFDDVGAGGASLLRLGFAAAIMLALTRPQVREHRSSDLRLAVLFGLVLGGMNYTFYEALDRLPLGVAVTIEFVGPLGVAVLTSKRRLDLVWAALAAAGILLLADPFGSGDGVDPVGLAFILAAAAFWASYILIAQRAGTRFDGMTGLALAMAVSVLVPLVPGLVQGGGDLLSPEILAIGVAVALASSVIPYALETEALRRLPANVFGIFMSLEPAVAALAGLIVLGQSLGLVDLVAMALVVTASIGVSRARRRDPV
jgi:inner membrane transporter RhtA